MTFEGPPRPPRRWHHATTTLEHFAVVTFRVVTDRLRGVVPSSFEPSVFAFADGSEGSLISVVAFVERDFRFRFAPMISVSGPLVDYRAYGSHRGERGVYVFRTSLDHPMVVAPRLLWRMPWDREAVRIDGEWDGPGPARVRVATDGVDGLDLVLTGRGTPPGPLDGFADADEAVEVLTHPVAGWYGPESTMWRYTVWHDVLRPEEATVDGARVPFFVDLGLVDREPRVHSALVVPTASFDVHTPPRRIR